MPATSKRRHVRILVDHRSSYTPRTLTYSFPRCFATFEVLLRQLHTIALFIVIVSYKSTFRTIKGKVGRSLMVELWSIISRSDLKVNHPKQSWHHP